MNKNSFQMQKVWLSFITLCSLGFCSTYTVLFDGTDAVSLRGNTNFLSFVTYAEERNFTDRIIIVIIFEIRTFPHIINWLFISVINLESYEGKVIYFREISRCSKLFSLSWSKSSSKSSSWLSSYRMSYFSPSGSRL